MRNRIAIQFAVAALLAGCAAIGVAEQPGKAAPLRLSVDLVDGSHIIGVPSIGSLRVQTDYAKMDIALEKIAIITMNDDGETASIELRNGDRLTGVPSLDVLKLATIFGDISVGAEHLTNLYVLAAGVDNRALALHYSFDKHESNKVTDQSGGKHDGENRGAKWIADGAVGGALHFSGGAYVSIPHSADFEFPDGDFSAALWVRPDTLDMRGSDAASLLDFESGGWRGWMLRFSRYYPSMSLGGGGDERPVIRSLPRIGEWTFMAVTYSAERKELKGYVDGALDMEQKTKLGLSRSPTDHAIGNNPEIPSQSFCGAIDEVMVYSRVLGEQEIKMLYRRGKQHASAQR